MDFRNVPCLPIHVNARHKPRGLNKMIHDEWNAILSIERLVEYVDSEPKRYRWIHARNFVTESCGRDVFLEINMYVYYVCVFKYVRASSCHFIRFGSVAIIWRRIAIHIWISILIYSLHWPFTRLDASYIEFSRSLSLSLSSSLVVYFLLWLPILIISVSIVPISVCKIQNEDYTFFTKRMYEFSVNEQICGKYYGKKSINPRNIVDYLKFQLSWSVNSVEIAILHLP